MPKKMEEKMEEFKEGDRVRYIGDSGRPFCDHGDTGTVEKHESTSTVWIKVDKNGKLNALEPYNLKKISKEEEMPKFEVGDKVKLNPSVEDFTCGRAGVDYDEVGTVEKADLGGGVVVHWPSYGKGWNGKVEELIHAKTKEDDGMDDPRNLLIQFMMEKQKLLGWDVNYFTAQDARAIMQWDKDEAEEVVGKIKAEVSVNEALVQASICPFCLYHIMCRKCDWAKNHKECALSVDLQDAVRKQKRHSLKVTQKLLDVLGKNRELKEGWVDYFLDEREDRPIVCGWDTKPEIYNSKEEALAARNKRSQDHICEPVKIQWYE